MPEIGHNRSFPDQSSRPPRCTPAQGRPTGAPTHEQTYSIVANQVGTGHELPFPGLWDTSASGCGRLVDASTTGFSGSLQVRPLRGRSVSKTPHWDWRGCISGNNACGAVHYGPAHGLNHDFHTKRLQCCQFFLHSRLQFRTMPQDPLLTHCFFSGFFSGKKTAFIYSGRTYRRVGMEQANTLCHADRDQFQ